MACKEFILEAQDKHNIPIFCWQHEKQPIKAVVQIVHGSCEHSKRYEKFAEFLAHRGFVVYANDHRGHGKSVANKDELGFFGMENGWQLIVDDVHQLTQYIKVQHPSQKIILLGHSMGSFMVRHYAILYGESIDGLIVMGTTHYNRKLLELGKWIANKDIRKGQPYNRNKILDYLSYSSFHHQFRKEKDSLAWLTRDKEIREKNRQDEHCGFKFTSSAFKDMFEGLLFITDEHQISQMLHELPVLFLSGEEDPVGSNGKMVTKTYQLFKQHGIKDITIKLYSGMRHEILNEIGKEQVYKDILDWINRLV